LPTVSKTVRTIDVPPGDNFDNHCCVNRVTHKRHLQKITANYESN
jgi:hypothetical protein